MKKTSLFVFLVLTVLFSGCIKRNDVPVSKNELLKIDSDFSKLSQKKGMHTAFLTYLDDSAVLLHANSYPIKGKNAIKEMYNKRPDTGFVLTWKPAYADIAESGEIGYTYGFYELKFAGKDSLNPIEHGTYTSIWKKDLQGKWKLVLDIGNQGLGTERKN
jgi:Ketosteroid isomerase homolog